MSTFLAHLWKMKYIRRWGLMRNVESENLHEHGWQVAVIAHMLANIHNQISDVKVDADKTASLALFHELGESIVGDVPTPVKYYNNEIKMAFSSIEEEAKVHLLSSIPDSLRDEYKGLVMQTEGSETEKILVKAADRISAYIKCRQELKYGNQDFVYAEKEIRKKLDEMKLKEVDIFLEQFLGSLDLTIDELNRK
jgi:5'-deoxynucleotidase